ncbi:IS200/IS605 family accessory protein TnpB-related protein [Thermodesulforhabdus norvegica]|uniref:IS200/IS605 family accessory protein TnpB-related protein n=1 Tax=Thermodesulforhabdus norvegica TaxID=39841 RepID=UPI001FDEF928|nr:IS200/IS605 family accessory protein TnpB-related protein [Thermodesulforhabdus norvegica]
MELKLKDGKVYAFASYEEVLPPVSIARDCGAIGIDLNASPLHIAWAEVGGDGNLMEYGRIDLHELIGKNRNQRENLLWEIAHRIVEIAKEKGKAIAFEDLRKLPGGTRGDGKARLRRRLGQFVYKSLLQKIEVLAGREGIEVVKASPAYTSVIGTLKYCPNHLIDKDIAGAYVVGRRALGLKERVPRNYAGLLSDREYLLCSLQRLIEEREDLKGRLKDERNEYKRRAIRGEIIKLNRDIKLLEEHLQSLEGESGTQHPVNQRKEQVRGSSHEGQKAWRVLRVALAIPLLGKSFARDFSPLRPVLVSGDWKRVAKRPVPAPGAGTTAHLQKCAVQVTRVEHGNGSARRRVSAYR